jgi:2-hydroxy-3-keto-5-methylthiopentenyl-1-phosphate phosphatase
MQDTGHTLFDNFGYGPDRRAVLAKQMESGERTFREVSDELYASLSVPFEDGFAVMKTALDIDPDFQAFHDFCINNGIPFHVISAGLKPVLRRVLNHFLEKKKAGTLTLWQMTHRFLMMVPNGKLCGDMIQTSGMTRRGPLTKQRTFAS